MMMQQIFIRWVAGLGLALAIVPTAMAARWPSIGTPRALAAVLGSLMSEPTATRLRCMRISRWLR